MLGGERQRDRILTNEEIGTYLESCERPWRDVATIMLGTGARPGECWEMIQLNGTDGLLQVTDGKRKAAREPWRSCQRCTRFFAREGGAADKPKDVYEVATGLVEVVVPAARIRAAAA